MPLAPSDDKVSTAAALSRLRSVHRQTDLAKGLVRQGPGAALTTPASHDWSPDLASIPLHVCDQATLNRFALQGPSSRPLSEQRG